VSARLRAALSEPRWCLGFGAAAFLLMVLHLSALGKSPPGLYVDEASVGYNAWAVAHTGHDEHGHFLPFYFEAFGEYKNPVYIYALAPLTRILPLTPFVVRLPAAVFSLAACAALALFAYAATRSRGAALLTLLTAGVTPWLVQEGRLGFEVISMVALLAVTLWCLARAAATESARWYGAAGAALGLSTFAYSTGRVFTVMLLVALPLCFGISSRSGAWLAAAIGPVAALVTLGIYVGLHQGAITARYNAISINFDTPGLPTLVQRFLSNYADYWDVRFLFTHGDPNLRHSTGFGGMLLVTTLPAILVGVAVCARRFREPLPRFVLLGAVLAPVPAALTAEGTPHSLRAACMLPFLLAFAAYGWCALLNLVRDRRAVAVAAALGVAVAAETGSYFYDMFVEYPGRAVAWFDTAQGPAMARAFELAGGHDVFVSSNLEGGYIDALFYLRPDPPPEGITPQQLLDRMGIHFVDPAAIRASAHPGDMLVLSPDDPVPSGAQVVEVDRTDVGGGAVSIVGSLRHSVDLVVIARD
jgi:4-amino-4-deoxy-L-arabinose transferase-like glycosyltransferase